MLSVIMFSRILMAPMITESCFKPMGLRVSIISLPHFLPRRRIVSAEVERIGELIVALTPLGEAGHTAGQTVDGRKEGVECEDGTLIFHHIVVGGVENGGVDASEHGSLAVSEGNHHRYTGTGVGTAEEVVEFPAIGRGFESGAVFFDHLVDAFSRGEAEKFFFVVGATHSTEGGEGDDEG